MVKPVEMPTDSQSLRKVLHEKIERFNEPQLSLINGVVMQLEAEALAHELDAAFDQDRAEGKLSGERIQRILSEVRTKHRHAP